MDRVDVVGDLAVRSIRGVIILRRMFHGESSGRGIPRNIDCILQSTQSSYELVIGDMDLALVA